MQYYDGWTDPYGYTGTHTVAIISMGRGAIVNFARKHKMNVASLTELELVSLTNVLDMIFMV